MALTPRRKIFVDKYLVDLNAIRTYKVVYPSCKKNEAAAINGSELLRNAKVAEYVQERMKDREKRTEITQDWVLGKLRKIASTNSTDFAHVVWGPIIRNNSYVVDLDIGRIQIRDVARITPTEELPEKKRAATSVIEETKFGINVKTYDRVRALELLGRHLEMFKDRVELSGGLDIEKTKLDDLLQ